MNTTTVLEVAGFKIERQDVSSVDRMPDVELGRLLGYSRPRDIRDLIGRHLADLPGILQRATMARGLNTGDLPSTITVMEYALTEEEALFIAARSETPAGSAVLKTLIKVFIEAREGRRTASGLSAADLQALAVQVAGLIRLPHRRARALQGQGELFNEPRRIALEGRVLELVDGSTTFTSAGEMARVLRARRADVLETVNVLRERRVLARDGKTGVYHRVRAAGRA